MEKKISRKNNSAKGIVTSLISNIVKIVIQFIFRSVFIYYLSVEFLGLNSTITGILNFLSVTELGISSAITFNLYKPVAENDIPKINSILKLYKKFYLIIGVAIIVIGMGILPCLKTLIKDANEINTNIYLTYIIYLICNALTYFWSYRNVLFTAYQHQYKVNVFNTVLNSVTSIVQIIAIILFKSFEVYMLIQLICAFASNITTFFYTKKLYPQVNVRGADALDLETKKDVYLNVKGMFYHKISYSILQGTDSVIISAFIGAITLGIYSNYSLFTTNIYAIFTLIVASLAGSIGNLIVENNPEKTYSIYKVLKLCFFWMAGFCSIALFTLFNPTIELWSQMGKWATDKVWTLDLFTIAIIVLNFYLLASRCITGVFREGIGNFHKDRFKGLVEALINLIVSIILVKPFGIAGVLMGTIVSCFCTSFWVDPYMIYKFHFKKSLMNHFKDVLFYTTVVLFAGIITYFTCALIPNGTIVNLIIKVIICAIIPNVIMLLCFIPTKEFKMLIQIAKNWIHKNN